MKKITLLLVAFTTSLFINAQVTLSHSEDPVTVDTGGVACWDSGTGEYRDNYFARAYNLPDFGIEGDFQINAVEFGVGSADDGIQVVINLYTSDSEDLSVANMEYIYDGVQALGSANDLTLVTSEVDDIAPAGSIVVVEIYAMDTGVPMQRYFPGFNLIGETAPGWLKADACGIVDYTQASSVVADQEYVINLVGETVASVNDELLAQVSVYPNPAVDVINVNVPSNVQIQNATLVDILGKNTGVSINNGTINVSGLAKGIYMLTVETSAGTLTQKVVKK